MEKWTGAKLKHTKREEKGLRPENRSSEPGVRAGGGYGDVTVYLTADIRTWELRT